jgi:hypothetical protein
VKDLYIQLCNHNNKGKDYGNSIFSLLHILDFCLAGERYDIVLNTEKATSSYWIMFRGHHQCKNLHQEALLVYNGATLPSELNEVMKSSLKVSQLHLLIPLFL